MMVNRGSRAEDQTMAYRGAVTNGAASTSVAKPSGVAVGDVVIFVIPDTTSSAAALTLTTSGGSAWTKSTFNVPAHSYDAVLFCKVLTALDVSNAWTLSSSEAGNTYAWIGNDAGSVSVQATTVNGVSQSTLTLTGFTPSQTHAAIAVVVDRDTDVTPTIGGGFTRRATGANAGNWISAVADNSDGGYTGANVVWSGLNGASGFADYGWLLKVTPG